MKIGGYRIGFAGSWARTESKKWASLCQTIGRELMSLGHRLITGGCSGGATQLCVDAAAAWLKENGRGEEAKLRILHVLSKDKDFPVVAHGQFLRCPDLDRAERRPVMASMADALITVEGGEGTMAEGNACQLVGTPVVPIGATGGSSLTLYQEIGPPSMAGSPYQEAVSEHEWTVLNKLGRGDGAPLGRQAISLALALARRRFCLDTSRSVDADLRTVFTIMPFSEDFDSVYNAVHHVFDRYDLPAADLRVTRADSVLTGHLDQLFDGIRAAPFVIVDITGNNPNVLLEYGYAMSLGKKAIVLNQRPEESPTDLKNVKQIPYHLDVLDELQDRLGDAIHEFYGDGTPP